MHSHPNARLTQKGYLRVVTQHLDFGRGLADLAAENGISLRCAYRWLARYLSIYNRLRKHSALGLLCAHLSSGSLSCSADEPGEKAHLGDLRVSAESDQRPGVDGSGVEVS